MKTHISSRLSLPQTLSLAPQCFCYETKLKTVDLPTLPAYPSLTALGPQLWSAVPCPGNTVRSLLGQVSLSVLTSLSNEPVASDWPDQSAAPVPQKLVILEPFVLIELCFVVCAVIPLQVCLSVCLAQLNLNNNNQN